MINTVILVFVGGAFGAMLREFFMLLIPHLGDGFPMDIFVANLVAALLLGVVSALRSREIVSDDVNTLLGTGVMGGLSTFSSFVYGAVVLMTVSTASMGVALAYLVLSVVLGFVAVMVGQKLGGQRPA